MNIALWIVAGVLAIAYFFGGGGKVLLSKEKLRSLGATSHWVDDYTAGTVKFIGVLEIVGALGLILPAALDIAPVLVPIAASGLMLVMAGAATTRLRRGEIKYLVGELSYLSFLAFVAWGRFGPESFTG